MLFLRALLVEDDVPIKDVVILDNGDGPVASRVAKPSERSATAEMTIAGSKFSSGPPAFEIDHVASAMLLVHQSGWDFEAP